MGQARRQVLKFGEENTLQGTRFLFILYVYNKLRRHKWKLLAIGWKQNFWERIDPECTPRGYVPAMSCGCFENN